MEIPNTILTAIEIMKKCFGGTEVKLLKDKLMYHQKYNAYGVSISIKILKEHNIFLTTSLSDDICFYGSHIANELIYEACKDDITQMERKVKMQKIIINSCKK